MKINEYNIEDVAYALGISVKNGRFSHHCPDKGVDPKEKYAKLNSNNTFMCFRCSGYGEKAIGNNTDLIKHTLGISTPHEVNLWAREHLIGFTPENTLINTESMISQLCSEIAAKAHVELLQNKAALTWLKKKYGIEKESVEDFTLGFITKRIVQECGEVYQQNFDLEVLANHICIPVTYQGVMNALTCRFYEGGGETSKVKYRRLSDTTETPEVVFNYDSACEYLKKHQEDTLPLIVCESEFDVILLHQMKQPYAVSVSSANSHNPFQCQQIALLSNYATAAMTLFDNDYGEKTNTGLKGAQTFIEKMLRLGVDFKRAILPECDDPKKTKSDVCELFVGGQEMDILTCIFTTMTESPTYFMDYVETQRENLHKPMVQKKIVEFLSKMKDSLQEEYIRIIGTIPEQYLDLQNAHQYKISKKVLNKILKARIAELKKMTTKTDGALILSDRQEDHTTRFFAQDYWYNKKYQQYHAKKMVHADVDIQIANEDGDVRILTERRPVEIEVVATPSGFASIHRAGQINLDELQEDEIAMIPDEVRTFNTIKVWSQNSGEYSISSFINSGGALTVDTGDIYNQIYGMMLKYFYFKHEAYAHVLTAFVLLSYTYMQFSAVPYLHFHGQKGTGKTAMASFMAEMCYRPIKASNPNDVHLYRSLHSGRGVFIYDEAEQLGGKYNQSERSQNIVLLCNASYVKNGALVPRQREGERGKTEWFYAYSPKVFMSISNLSEALKSRCIEIQSIKIPKSKIKDYDNIEDQMILLEADIQEIKNKLCVWSLTQFVQLRNQYLETVQELRLKDGIANRDLQLWSPLMAIMKQAGHEEGYQTCLEYLLKVTEWQNDEAQTMPRTEMLKVMKEVMDDSANRVFFKIPDTENFYLCVRGELERLVVAKLSDVSNGTHPYLRHQEGAEAKIQNILYAAEILKKKQISQKDVTAWGREDVKRSNVVYEIDYSVLTKELSGYDENAEREGL